MSGDRSIKKFSLLILIALFLGCATAGPGSRTAASLERSKVSQEWLNEVDGAIRRAGVIDASSFPVPGFPYLRTSRFLLAMKNRVRTEQEKAEWVQLMRQLDEDSREKEIHNLPQSELSRLKRNGAAPFDRQEVIAEARSSAQELFSHDTARPDFYKSLFPVLKAPDEYSYLRRDIGFFPIVSIPVNIVSEKVKKRFQALYDEPIDKLPLEGNIKLYSPRLQSGFSPEDVAQMLRTASSNPLGIPMLDEIDRGKLAIIFAPVLIQDVAGLYDRIGRVFWKESKPDVDPLNPSVYYYFSHALLHNHPIVQINYVLWYSDRTGDQSPRIERGHLDGLTLRISLDPEGKPFMVDVMNNCGCYHFFSPRKEAVLEVKSRPYGLEPFVPEWMPEVEPGERFGIRVNSGWHQVERLLPVYAFKNGIKYDLVPYRSLESLPTGSGNHRSIFDSRGIAIGTGRIEPLVFFSMGIPSIGSMRQRGHHAIELTGHDHFDDPMLFEKNFIFR